MVSADWPLRYTPAPGASMWAQQHDTTTVNTVPNLLRSFNKCGGGASPVEILCPRLWSQSFQTWFLSKITWELYIYVCMYIRVYVQCNRTYNAIYSSSIYYTPKPTESEPLTSGISVSVKAQVILRTSPASELMWWRKEREGGLNPTLKESGGEACLDGMRFNMALFRLSAEQVNYCRSVEHVCWGLLRKMVSHQRQTSKNEGGFLTPEEWRDRTHSSSRKQWAADWSSCPNFSRFFMNTVIDERGLSQVPRWHSLDTPHAEEKPRQRARRQIPLLLEKWQRAGYKILARSPLLWLGPLLPACLKMRPSH